ncbi:MAG: hypothetical protein R3F48_14880 [Candidatus Zixiibacteriota bacterium]
MRALEVIDPEFTDAHWQAYTALLEQLHERFNSFHNHLTWEQKKKQVLSVYDSQLIQHRFIIIDDDGTVTGWFDFYIMNKGTSAELAFVGFDGDFEDIPLSFSQAMASALDGLLRHHSCPKMYIMSSNQRTSRIVREWGGSEVCLFNRYELRRDEVDESMLRQWVKIGERANPELSMRYYVEIPDDILDRYMEIMRQCLSDMPRENDTSVEFLPTVEDYRKQSAWRKNNNRVQLSSALFDAKDQIIGFSQIVVSTDDPKNAFQMMTGLERSYRGKKLSKWLKAAVILKLGEDFPKNETITTDMRAVNAPIQRLNELLGYKLLSEGNEFELAAPALADWVAQQS